VIIMAEKQDAPKEEKAEKPAEEKSEVKEAPKEEPKKESKPAGVNYVHAALLLHSAGKDITEDGLKKVIDATGAKADSAQLKSLVASLDGVDIDDAISQIAAPAAAAAPAAGEAKKEEKKEENVEKKSEEAASGLSSLFG